MIADDCHMCCVACTDGIVYVYNLCSAELLHTLPASNKNPVSAMCIAKNQHFLFTASKVSENNISSFLYSLLVKLFPS